MMPLDQLQELSSLQGKVSTLMFGCARRLPENPRSII